MFMKRRAAVYQLAMSLVSEVDQLILILDGYFQLDPPELVFLDQIPVEQILKFKD